MLILLSILKHSKAAGEKVLVFTNNLSTLDYLQYLLISHDFTFLRLDGSAANRRSRHDDITTFSTGEHDAYIISTKAGGQGINLSAASRVIILDADFSPMWDEQPVGRAYRLGQKKEVFVYHLIAEGSVDTQLARIKHLKHRWQTSLQSPVMVESKRFGKEAEFWGLDRLVLDRVVREEGLNKACSEIHVLFEPAEEVDGENVEVFVDAPELKSLDTSS
ncbi:P-loop containing nucleoside triphosphate hydrolase protein [Trichophaea hybrida]|nr:P-loop containing nucleoside triphosphate hydrolase protein [Trichophaea hybrida]